VVVCLLLIAAIPLLLHLRQQPVVVLALIAIIAVGYPERGAVALPLLVALFVVAQRSDRRVTAASAVATVALLAAWVRAVIATRLG
jgi:hypothetical protein